MEASQAQVPAAVTLRRSFAVAPEKVWRAWTDPQALIHWFGSGDPAQVLAVDMHLRVGGSYRILFIAPNGEESEASGVYQEVEPNRRLVFSWAWRSTPERVSRITLAIEPQAGGSELVFTHDRFFDEAASARHRQGWEYMFTHLEAWLATQVRS